MDSALFLLFKNGLKILNLPPIAIKAPKGQINLQKNLSINIPKNNNKTAYKIKYHSLLNFIDIAVLKGSTSEPKFSNPGEIKQDKNKDKSIKYLIFRLILLYFSEILICLIFNILLKLLSISCKAPNGQSQPQKIPLPQIKKVIITYDIKTINKGSDRSVFQEGCVI